MTTASIRARWNPKRRAATTGSRRRELPLRNVLLQLIAERQDGLGAHVSSVADLAAETARRLGLSAPEISRTRLAAELHDVGKTAVPESILSKPGPLDEREWAVVRRHPLVGERILAAAPALAKIAPIVRSSHERHDGLGYPDGLKSDEIPVEARIVAVADAFDAMTAWRPYGRVMTRAETLAELQRCAGTQFDPVVVDACRGVVESRA